MAKALLFNPPGPHKRGWTREGRCTQPSGVWGTQWPPVSLASAAAVLEADGHRVRVVDFPARGRGEADLVRLLSGFQPDIAVWNTGTPTLSYDLSMGRLLRRWAPNAVTGVMGTHVTAEPGSILAAPGIDLVVHGEPEGIIRDLCRRLPEAWRGAAGISYRAPGGKGLVQTPPADPLSPETIPSPAWHFLDLDAYRLPLKGRRFLIVAPVRGCPYPCTFCTAPVYYGKQLRARPVGRVADEIEEDIRRYGTRDIFIWADTFTARRQYVIDFCRALKKRRLAVRWACNSRVDTVDRGMLESMKSAGLWMISFGVESGDEAVLRRCRKHITPAQSRRAIRLAADLGIRTSGHFIFGLPGETPGSLRRTLDFALDLPLDIVQFYTAAAFPGTQLYREAVRRHWLDPARPRSQNRAGLDLPGLGAEEVDAFRKYAYRRFYLRTSAVRRVLRMVEPGAVRTVAENVRSFFQWATG